MDAAHKLPRPRPRKGRKRNSQLYNIIYTPDGIRRLETTFEKQQRKREENRIKFDVEEQPLERCLRNYSRNSKLMPSAKIGYNYLLGKGYSEETAFQVARGNMFLYRHIRKTSKGVSKEDCVEQWFQKIFKNLAIIEPVPGQVAPQFARQREKDRITPLDRSDNSKPPEDNGPPRAEEDDKNKSDPASANVSDETPPPWQGFTRIQFVPSASGSTRNPGPNPGYCPPGPGGPDFGCGPIGANVSDESPSPRQGFTRIQFVPSASGSIRNPGPNPGYCPPGAGGPDFGCGPIGANFADQRFRPQEGFIRNQFPWSAPYSMRNPGYPHNPGYWPDGRYQPDPCSASRGLPMYPCRFSGPVSTPFDESFHRDFDFPC